MFGVLTLDRKTEEYQKKEQSYRRRSWVAMFCLVVGFLLQILGQLWVD